MNWLVAIIFAALLQGSLLLLAVGRMQEGRQRVNLYFRFFIGLLLAKLTGKLLFLFYPASIFLMKFLLVGDVIIFLLPAALFLYLRRLTGIELLERYPVYIHFIPAAVYVISTFPFLIVSDDVFLNMMQNSRIYFLLVEFAGIVWNLFYFTLNQTIVKRLIKSSDQFLSFSNHKPYAQLLNGFYAVVLLCWIFHFLLSNFVYSYTFSFWAYQSIWLLMSVLVFTLTYFALTKPQLFQMYELAQANELPLPTANPEPVNLIAYQQLLQIIALEKPYLDPELTLAKLATICKLHTHELSRLINQHADKNFFEFVNGYRVEEFKRIATPDAIRQFTLLGLAFQAGFNSKTTFNEYFKRHTSMTPSAYVAAQTTFSM